MLAFIPLPFSQESPEAHLGLNPVFPSLYSFFIVTVECVNKECFPDKKLLPEICKLG